jgi:DNA-binding NtrC family response regulator
MLHCPRLLWVASHTREDAHQTIMDRASESPSAAGAAGPAGQDDDSALAALFHLERAGSVRQALRALDAAYFDVVLIESAGGGLGWRDDVETLAAHPAGVPVIVLKAATQGSDNMGDWGAALRSGAFDLVSLPCRADSLIAVCEHAVVTGEARRWHGVTLEEQFVSQVA